MAQSDGNRDGKPIHLQFKGDDGSAARFFYCAKAGKKERNKGLGNSLITKIDRKKKICADSMVVVELLKKVISDTRIMSFSIDESGANIMVECQKDSLSIISTKIKRIIELKTLDYLTLSLTSDSIADVSYEKARGGNLAENVESLKKWLLTITKGNQELALGASSVALQTLLKLNKKGNWQPATNFHATVKPVTLMKYLCRMITPKNGTVLDPFMGSGSTGIAARRRLQFHWYRT